MFREIGFETVERFKRSLLGKLNKIMPYYTQLYQTELRSKDIDFMLNKDLEEVYQKMPAQRTRLDKDLLKLDEQANLIYQLMNFQLIQIFPQEEHPEHKWYAPGDDLSSFSGKDSLFVAMVFRLGKS